MRETFVNGMKNEKEMFRSWLSIEKERWEKMRGANYEETATGLIKENLASLWQSDLYQVVAKEEKKYTHLYTYLWRDKMGKFYYVDFGEENFDFRISLGMTDAFFSAEILIKEKEETKYERLMDSFPFLKGETKRLKGLIEELLSVYEKVKTVVFDAPSNRLLILFDRVEVYETQIREINDYYHSFDEEML